VATEGSEVATVVALRGERVLLVAEGLAGGLALPGGKLEHGESARAAAARELAEETGIVVSAGSLVALGEPIQTAAGVTLTPFLLADAPARRRPAELPCQWVALAQLHHHALATGVARSVDAAVAARAATEA
jgi:ADP-ribose pyrophosphatase YjhB (NUDIX family)